MMLTDNRKGGNINMAYKYYFEQPSPFLKEIGVDDNPVNHYSRLVIVEEGAVPEDDYIKAYVCDYDSEDTVHVEYLSDEVVEIPLKDFISIAGKDINKIPRKYWDFE